MRDQPQAWQHRSNDAAESATGTMPTPRDPADDDRAIPTDSTRTESWAPERDVSPADSREASGTDVAGSPDIDAPTSSPDVDAASRLPGEPAVGVAHVPDSEDGADQQVADDRAADQQVADDRAADQQVADERAADQQVADEQVADQQVADERAADEPAAGDAAARDAAARDGAARDGARSDAAAGEPGDREGDAELMPGDVPEQPASALFAGSSADGFRDRWQRVQMRFVDNPRGAADEARALTDDVVSALHDTLNERIAALGEWQSGQAGDTEELRVAVRRYRDLLDRLLGL